MRTTVYGIGCGPGDPRLLTLRAVELLTSADLIVAPKATAEGESVALEIARRYLRPDCAIEKMTFPMSADRTRRSEAARLAADVLADAARAGRLAAMITLGDPMTYSTWGYVARELAAHHDDVACETIPGVTSYSAVAARLGEALAEADEPLLVWPATLPDDLGRMLELAPNVVALKVGKRLDALVEAAEASGATVSAARRIGMDGERIARDAVDLLSDEPDYFTTAIVHKEPR